MLHSKELASLPIETRHLVEDALRVSAGLRYTLLPILKDLEKKSTEALNDANTLRQDLDTAEQDLDTAEQDLSTSQRDLDSAADDRDRAERKVAKLTAHIDDLKAAFKEYHASGESPELTKLLQLDPTKD